MSNINITNINKLEKIGLTIETNGNKLFYIQSDVDIDVIDVDVRVVNPSLENGKRVYVENNAYSFKVRMGVKKYTQTQKYQQEVIVKIINSPVIPCSEKDKSTLHLKFYINYVKDGKSRRITTIYKNPEELHHKEDDYIIYHSPQYKNRATYSYGIELDSIYRPFFFNSVLLFVNDESTDNTSNPYAKFYFSIANGCTMRVDDKYKSYYKIGDINLNINNYKNVNESYEITIKDNFRMYSEIEDFEGNDDLKAAHIRGIRESGTNAKNENYEGGIYLPKINGNNTLVTKQTFTSGLRPTNIMYYESTPNKNGDEIDVYDINFAHKFNIKQPLNISFSVKDASPDDIDYRLIEVKCRGVIFPEEIELLSSLGDTGYLSFKSNEYDSNISFIPIKNKGVLNNFYTILDSLNVNDCESIGGIFSFLKEIEPYTFFLGGANNDKYLTLIREYPEYVLAIYHGGYIYNGELLNYINHTNKLLIMRLYKIL